jgi:ubiquitin-conjugating enzyme E2 J1
MATCMGRADRSVTLYDSDKTTASRNSFGPCCSYNWTPRLFPSERSSCRGRWCTRGSHKRAQASRGVVSITRLFSPRHHSCPRTRSRDWVCPRCNRSNLECLPDPAQPNDASTLGPVSEAKTPSEAEVVPTPMPPQPPESEASVSEPEANPGGADGASQSESDDTTSVDKTATTSVVASSHSSASSAQTPSQNISDVHGARQTVPASFRPSHTARPPMLLDTAICVLLALVFALLCRRVF